MALFPAFASASVACFEFRPGVLVDPSGGVCFVMSTGDGVDAVDLETGALRWTTTRAQKPLVIVGGSLLAQVEPPSAGVLELAVLDAASGTLLHSVSADLPAAILASVASGSFRLDAHALPPDAVVRWAYAREALHGAETVPADSSSSTVEYGGALYVDLGTGRTRAAPTEDVDEPDRAPLPPKLAELAREGRLPRTLWRADSTYTALVHGEGNNAVLSRWSADTGRSLPDVELDVDDYTIRYASADQRCLLASRRIPSAPPDKAYDWIVYSLATGKRVAQLRMAEPAAWFFVTKGLLVHEVRPRAPLVGTARSPQPGKIRAVDLQTGEERWSHSVRDTAERGSPPPGTTSTDDAPAPPESPNELR